MEEIRNEELNEEQVESYDIDPVEDIIDEDDEDHDFAKGLGIGALLGAAVLYGGSKVVKKVKERKRKARVVNFVDKVKEKLEKKKEEPEEEFIDDEAAE